MLEMIDIVDERTEFISQLIEKFGKGEATLSYTAISNFKKSPKSFIDYKMAKTEKTDAMRLGSLVHCLVLEPEKFKSIYATDKEICDKLIDEGAKSPRATTKYKEWKAEQGEKEVVSPDSYETAKLMADSVLNNSAAAYVLSLCDKRELKVEFEYNGLRFIGFLDADGFNATVDLKICADAEPRKFQRDIINMGYHLQSGVYTVASGDVKPYYIIAVDRSGGVSVHELTENLVDYGMKEFERLTNEFNQCLANNDFHKSYEYRANTDTGIYSVSKPPYL